MSRNINPVVVSPFDGGGQLAILQEIRAGICCIAANQLGSDITDLKLSTRGDIEVCRVDDVNGDGTSLVYFTEVYCYDPAVGGYVLDSRFTDEPSTAYTPVGTVTGPNNVGTVAVQNQQRALVENGGTWDSTASTLSYVIKAITVTGSPTFTDTEGTITPIFAGETITFSADDGVPNLLKPNVTLTTTAGDVFIVEFSELDS